MSCLALPGGGAADSASAAEFGGGGFGDERKANVRGATGVELGCCAEKLDGKEEARTA